MMRRAAVLLLLSAGCGSSSTTSSTSPEGVRGGSDFDSAVSVGLRWNAVFAPGGAPQHFKWPARPGFLTVLRWSVSEVRTGAGATCELLDGSRRKIGLSAGTDGVLEWLPSAADGGGVQVVRVSPIQNVRTTVAFELEQRDWTDAGTGTDAGSDPAGAAAATGSFAGSLAGRDKLPGSDGADVYRLAVEPGKRVQLRISSPPRLKLEVSVLDEDGKALAQKSGANEGATIPLEWTPAAAGTVHLRIEASPASAVSEGGRYTVEIVR